MRRFYQQCDPEINNCYDYRNDTYHARDGKWDYLNDHYHYCRNCAEDSSGYSSSGQNQPSYLSNYCGSVQNRGSDRYQYDWRSNSAGSNSRWSNDPDRSRNGRESRNDFSLNNTFDDQRSFPKTRRCIVQNALHHGSTPTDVFERLRSHHISFSPPNPTNANHINDDVTNTNDSFYSCPPCDSNQIQMVYDNKKRVTSKSTVNHSSNQTIDSKPSKGIIRKPQRKKINSGYFEIVSPTRIQSASSSREISTGSSKPAPKSLSFDLSKRPIHYGYFEVKERSYGESSAKQTRDAALLGLDKFPTKISKQIDTSHLKESTTLDKSLSANIFGSGVKTSDKALLANIGVKSRKVLTRSDILKIVGKISAQVKKSDKMVQSISNRSLTNFKAVASTTRHKTSRELKTVRSLSEGSIRTKQATKRSEERVTTYKNYLDAALDKLESQLTKKIRTVLTDYAGMPRRKSLVTIYQTTTEKIDKPFEGNAQRVGGKNEMGTNPSRTMQSSEDVIDSEEVEIDTSDFDDRSTPSSAGENKPKCNYNSDASSYQVENPKLQMRSFHEADQRSEEVGDGKEPSNLDGDIFELGPSSREGTHHREDQQVSREPTSKNNRISGMILGEHHSPHLAHSNGQNRTSGEHHNMHVVHPTDPHHASGELYSPHSTHKSDLHHISGEHREDHHRPNSIQSIRSSTIRGEHHTSQPHHPVHPGTIPQDHHISGEHREEHHNPRTLHRSDSGTSHGGNQYSTHPKKHRHTSGTIMEEHRDPHQTHSIHSGTIHGEQHTPHSTRSKEPRHPSGTIHGEHHPHSINSGTILEEYRTPHPTHVPNEPRCTTETLLEHHTPNPPRSTSPELIYGERHSRNEHPSAPSPRSKHRSKEKIRYCHRPVDGAKHRSPQSQKPGQILSKKSVSKTSYVSDGGLLRDDSALSLRKIYDSSEHYSESNVTLNSFDMGEQDSKATLSSVLKQPSRTARQKLRETRERNIRFSHPSLGTIEEEGEIGGDSEDKPRDRDVSAENCPCSSRQPLFDYDQEFDTPIKSVSKYARCYDNLGDLTDLSKCNLHSSPCQICREDVVAQGYQYEDCCIRQTCGDCPKKRYYSQFRPMCDKTQSRRCCAKSHDRLYRYMLEVPPYRKGRERTNLVNVISFFIFIIVFYGIFQYIDAGARSGRFL